MKKLLIILVCFVVLLLSVLVLNGCAVNAAKGRGSLLSLKTDFRIGEAPSTHQIGVNVPWKDNGVARITAGHKAPTPMDTTSVTIKRNTNRSARD